MADSLSYLDISDATVITFLVPTITAFICWVTLKVSPTALRTIISPIGLLLTLVLHRSLSRSRKVLLA